MASLDKRRYALGLTLRQLAEVSGVPLRYVQLVMDNERASMKTAKLLDEVLTRLEAEAPPKIERPIPAPVPKPKAAQNQPDHHHVDDDGYRAPSVISRAERLWAEGFRRIGRDYAGPLRATA